MSTPFFICHIFIIQYYQLRPNILFTFTFLCLFYLFPDLPLLSSFFFHQSSSSHSCSSIFLSKHFHVSFLSTITFSCLLLFYLPYIHHISIISLRLTSTYSCILLVSLKYFFLLFFAYFILSSFSPLFSLCYGNPE